MAEVEVSLTTKTSTTWYVESTKGWIYGDVTRELFAVWASLLGESKTFVEESQLQKLFNEIALFPSKSQVFEMIHCSRESCKARGSLFNEEDKVLALGQHEPPHSDDNAAKLASDSGVKSYLTFGEFCVFATELRRLYQLQQQRSDQNKNTGCQEATSSDASATSSESSSNCSSLNNKSQEDSKSSAYDVFLGGSCNPTTWRQHQAIPYLKSQGITYYNPQQPNWVPEMIELEHQAKQTSKVLLFVLANCTRNVASMIEISYLSGGSASRGRRLVVVIEKYPERAHRICDEEISSNELSELTFGQVTVHDLVERQGIPVFDSLDVALNCTAKLIREDLPMDQLTIKDKAQPVKHAHLQLGDKVLRMREAFATLDAQQCGKLSLWDIKMAFRIHTHKDLSSRDVRAIVRAQDPTSFASSTEKSNSSFYRSPVSGVGDQLRLDFNAFCSIVAEFKHHRKEAKTEDKTKHTWSFFRMVRSAFFSSNPFAPGTSGRNKKGGGNSRIRAKGRTTRSSAGRRGSSVRDVYLGGSPSSGPSCWRERDAIPTLKKNGLTFFRPPEFSAACRRRRLMPIEASTMDNSRILLFVILCNSRSLSCLCEAAYHIGMRRSNVVLCVQKIPESGSVDETGETLSCYALKDYNRGRCYLSDIANREGVPVFDNVTEAVECAVHKCNPG